MSKGGRYNAPHEDRRANPHLPEYDPRYVTPSPQPHYQQFPQPFYEHRHRANRYESKPFNYQYDDRYFRVTDQEYQRQQERQREYEHDQQRQREERFRHSHMAGPQYGPSMHQAHGERERYDPLPAAGRANRYNVRITDLLTSVREPQMRDDAMSKLMEVNKGYLVLMRFRPDFMPAVINAMQFCTSTLSADNGYVIGFAEPKHIVQNGPNPQRMMEVLVSNYQPNSGDQWWSTNDSKASQFGVCCLWFKDFNSANSWFESAPRIKHKEFPEHHPFQAVAIPLTFGGNAEPLPFSTSTEEITLLWCEYPQIYERYQDDFLQNYSEPARRRIKYHYGTPNVSVSKFKPTWPQKPNRFGQPEYSPRYPELDRVGRPLRNSWVEPETFISVSTFPTMQNLKDFFHDSEYQQCLSSLHRYSAPVFVAMTLQFVRGTRRK